MELDNQDSNEKTGCFVKAFSCPAYDLDQVGHGRLSVFLPKTSWTKELRSELRRMFGEPSVEYLDQGWEEWFIDNGFAVLHNLRRKASWKAVFGGKQTRNSEEFGRFSGKREAI